MTIPCGMVTTAKIEHLKQMQVQLKENRKYVRFYSNLSKELLPQQDIEMASESNIKRRVF